MKISDSSDLKKTLEIDDKTLARFRQIQKNTLAQAKKLGQKKTKLVALGISGSARDHNDMAQEDSNSEFLLGQAMNELKSLGAKTEIIKLRNYNIKPCKACYSTVNTQCHFYCSCYPKGKPSADDMSNIIYDKVLAADIIIFATPVNNFKISSFMALFIDRCISLDGSLEPADPKFPKNKELNIKHTKFIELTADQKIPGSGFLRRFMGKVGGILVTGHEAGAALTISQLMMTLTHFGMSFSGWSNMYAINTVTQPTFVDKKFVNSEFFSRDAREVARNAYILANALNKSKVKKTDWKHDYNTN
jgi:multimeric flavodoxin WrbA